MKKIIFLLMLFLLTGCTVKYNIEFKDDKIYENFTVSVNNSSESGSIKYLKDNDFYAYINPEMIKYKKEIKKGNKITKFNYSYEYKIEDYKNSMALSTCFRGYSVIKEKNYYLFSTSEGLKCMTSDYSTTIDELDIVITSNHKLIDTNADEISKDTYIWHINKDNYTTKSIMLKLYQDKYISNYKGELVKKIIIFSLIIGTIVLSITLLIIKRKKSNKI